MDFLSLSSGSAGNCYYIGDGSRGLLIDAGVSLRSLKRTLSLSGLNIDSFSAILVTHDHMDHIRSIGSYCKHLGKPVYSKETIHNALARHSAAVPHIHSCRRILPEAEATIIDGFSVRWFTVPHDASDTVGYYIESDGLKFTIMTDIGKMTDEALDYARVSDTVVLESNYDTDMLMSGPYPHVLKMRICKGCGHLSNLQCADAIKDLYHPGLRHLFLCHLSENNNTPSLALNSAKEALASIGVSSDSIDLRTLPRTSASALIRL